MSESLQFKGTPGEWRLVNGVIETHDGMPLFHKGRSKEEMDANAKLISAAPEMLHAMIEFCDRVDVGEVRSTKTYNQFKLIINKILS